MDKEMQEENSQSNEDDVNQPDIVVINDSWLAVDPDELLLQWICQVRSSMLQRLNLPDTNLSSDILTKPNFDEETLQLLRTAKALATTTEEIIQRCEPFKFKESSATAGSSILFLKRAPSHVSMQTSTHIRSGFNEVSTFVEYQTFEKQSEMPPSLPEAFMKLLGMDEDDSLPLGCDLLLERVLILDNSMLPSLLIPLKAYLESLQVYYGIIESWIMHTAEIESWIMDMTEDEWSFLEDIVPVGRLPKTGPDNAYKVLSSVSKVLLETFTVRAGREMNVRMDIGSKETRIAFSKCLEGLRSMKVPDADLKRQLREVSHSSEGRGRSGGGRGGGGRGRFRRGGRGRFR